MKGPASGAPIPPAGGPPPIPPPQPPKGGLQPRKRQQNAKNPAVEQAEVKAEHKDPLAEFIKIDAAELVKMEAELEKLERKFKIVKENEISSLKLFNEEELLKLNTTDELKKLINLVTNKNKELIGLKSGLNQAINDLKELNSKVGEDEHNLIQDSINTCTKALEVVEREIRMVEKNIQTLIQKFELASPKCDDPDLKFFKAKHKSLIEEIVKLHENVPLNDFNAKHEQAIKDLASLHVSDISSMVKEYDNIALKVAGATQKLVNNKLHEISDLHNRLNKADFIEQGVKDKISGFFNLYTDIAAKVNEGNLDSLDINEFNKQYREIKNEIKTIKTVKSNEYILIEDINKNYTKLFEIIDKNSAIVRQIQDTKDSYDKAIDSIEGDSINTQIKQLALKFKNLNQKIEDKKQIKALDKKIENNEKQSALLEINLISQNEVNKFITDAQSFEQQELPEGLELNDLQKKQIEEYKSLQQKIRNEHNSNKENLDSLITKSGILLQKLNASPEINKFIEDYIKGNKSLSNYYVEVATIKALSSEREKLIFRKTELNNIKDEKPDFLMECLLLEDMIKDNNKNENKNKELFAALNTLIINYQTQSKEYKKAYTQFNDHLTSLIQKTKNNDIEKLKCNVLLQQLVAEMELKGLYGTDLYNNVIAVGRQYKLSDYDIKRFASNISYQDAIASAAENDNSLLTEFFASIANKTIITSLKSEMPKLTKDLEATQEKHKYLLIKKVELKHLQEEAIKDLEPGQKVEVMKVLEAKLQNEKIELKNKEAESALKKDPINDLIKTLESVKLEIKAIQHKVEADQVEREKEKKLIKNIANKLEIDDLTVLALLKKIAEERGITLDLELLQKSQAIVPNNPDKVKPPAEKIVQPQPAQPQPAQPQPAQPQPAQPQIEQPQVDSGIGVALLQPQAEPEGIVISKSNSIANGVTNSLLDEVEVIDDEVEQEPEVINADRDDKIERLSRQIQDLENKIDTLNERYTRKTKSHDESHNKSGNNFIRGVYGLFGSASFGLSAIGATSIVTPMIGFTALFAGISAGISITREGLSVGTALDLGACFLASTAFCCFNPVIGIVITGMTVAVGMIIGYAQIIQDARNEMNNSASPAK